MNGFDPHRLFDGIGVACDSQIDGPRPPCPRPGSLTSNLLEAV
jgi:hypothetical protein